MIVTAWTIYFFLSFLLSALFRKLVVNKYLKKLLFAFVLSLFITIWFNNPGSENLSPIIPIYLMDFFQGASMGLQRLIRPFILVMITTIILDFLLDVFKSKS